MGYPQDPPQPPPEYGGPCPYCGVSDEEIEFFDTEYDGDEDGIYMSIIYKCNVCHETF